MMKNVVWIILGVLVFAGGLIFSFEGKGNFSPGEDYTYRIDAKWELPDILEEVSGIEWLDENKIACIQDEDGIIFIYELSSSKIKKEIKFAGPGDYEGIAIDDETAYVLRSDGTIFEIQEFQSSKPIVSKHNTFLTDDQNVEGLCLDKENNRLLLALKDKDLLKKDFKGVYSFVLSENKLLEQPFFELDLNDKLLSESGDKISKRLRPAEIEIHPISSEIYILDAKLPKLLILSPSGIIKKIYKLNEDDFSQPEGLTFTPDGTLYISNEAGSNAANILKVKLNN
ncbi:SdiA-regulated domain-containing protein [uncultured Christiangramia sp.]|uniref:SdiA-regulated domain-containing protein n=1 Tax=Christiangramia sp. 3-2217-3z TaxID=3417564 RepID=UPI0026348F97|nr:SdiA-regulated domain-containing protein [uncultured Christiangramia sp.]